MMKQTSLSRVQEAWAARVSAEYASAAVTSELLHGLISLGAGPDTLRKCHKIVAEELAHADVSRHVLLAAGGSSDQVPVSAEALSIPHAPGEPLGLRLALFVADFFCCGETVAAPLFHSMITRTRVPIALKSLRLIAKDESTHGAFGWEVLEEILELAPSGTARAVEQCVPEFIKRIELAYNVQFEVNDAEESWGLMSGSDHARIAHEALDTLARPRFAALFNAR